MKPTKTADPRRRFRVPEGSDEPLRISLTTGGHTICITPEEGWREGVEPMFHAKLIAAGAETDLGGAGVDPKGGEEITKTSPDEDPEHGAAIRKAIATMLERMGDAQFESDFTQDGVPNTNIVSQLAGFGAKKKDVMVIFRRMEEEAKADAAKNGGGDED